MAQTLSQKTGVSQQQKTSQKQSQTTYQKATQALKADLLDMPLARLIQKLTDELSLRTEIDLLEIEPPEPVDDDLESVDVEEDDWIVDAPEMPPLEIETGEGIEDDEDYVPEPIEPFEQYIMRRLIEDFGQDPTYKRWLEELQIDPDATGVDETFKNWFTGLLDEYAGHSEGEREMVQEPLIIFKRNNGKLSFHVNLGEPARLGALLCQGETVPLNINVGGNKFIGIEPNIITEIVNEQLQALSIAAEFIIEKQSAFLLAEDLPSAMELLRSADTNEMLDYLSKRGITRDKSWVSRLRKQWFKCPLKDSLFPLGLLLDGKPTILNILKKALDLHALGKKDPPLNATDQLLIIKTILGQKVSFNTENIKKTYQPILEKLYSKEDWENLKPKKGRSKKLEPEYLACLCQKIASQLKYEVEDITKEKVEKLREGLKKKQPK